MKSFKTANVLRRKLELLTIPSKFCTKIPLNSLNLTVANGFVKISAKFNFVGTYFQAIFCFFGQDFPAKFNADVHVLCSIRMRGIVKQDVHCWFIVCV